MSVCMFQMYGNIEEHYVVNLPASINDMLKLKINVNFPQLLCVVVSASQNGGFERFGGFQRK